MDTETRPAPAQGAPAVPNSGRPAEPAPVPENWKPLFAELTTYYRLLPQLLSEGEAGRFVVIKGDKVCGTWDSYRDANQYGTERFGDQLFMVQRVEPRDLARLARYFPPREAACQP